MRSERHWRRLHEAPVPLSRVRVFAVLFVAFTLGFITIFRLVEIQLVRHDFFAERALQQYQNRRLIEPNRGKIFDRLGNELAINIPNYFSIGVRPRAVENAAALARDLAGILEIDTRKLLREIRSRNSFFWVRRKVEPQIAGQVRALSHRAIVLKRETKRKYPYGPVGAQTIGFVGVDNNGLGGIELTFDDVLRGEPGWEVLQQYGSYRQMIDGSYPRRQAIDGGEVVLSMDINAQAIAEEELLAAVRKYDATGGMIVITRPSSGEILAIASIPRFDPNDGEFRREDYRARQNRAVTEAFEPGSTFKIVPFAGLFERNLLEIDETIYCEKGNYQVADRTIRDVHPYTNMTASEVLIRSSNIGTVKLAERFEKKGFYTLIRDFGFGQETGIELNGETRGLLKSPAAWSGVSLANLAIGQGIGVTALQMAMAFGALANDGLLMKPLLVLSVTHPDGTIELNEPRVIRRVVSPSTARAMRILLAEAVSNGTGRPAAIEGVKVAGKTGTAQKVDRENMTYYQDRFISSFAGFLPTEHPELLAVVVIDDPQGDYYGGIVAAPVFRKIMERLLVTIPRHDPFYADERFETEDDKRDEVRIVPSLLSLTRPEAERKLRRFGIEPMWVGEGEIVIGQGSAPGTELYNGAAVQVVLGPCAVDCEKVRVPDLKGLDIRDAISVLSQLGLRARVEGSGLIYEQQPRPGGMLKVGGRCSVRAGTPPELQPGGGAS